MRAHVAESWQRSAAAGVDAETVQAPITLPQDALRDHRQDHVLARVFPLLDDVLGQAARDCDAIMAVSDQSGQLLWVCGSPATLRRAEAIGFVEGSNWDERLAGTNAPGMALALDRPISVLCWNVQFAAGRDRVFFYDGGRAVRVPQETVRTCLDRLQTAGCNQVDDPYWLDDCTKKAWDCIAVVPGAEG